MTDEGVRALAAAVLLRAVADAAKYPPRRIGDRDGVRADAMGFLRGAEGHMAALEFWCALAGMEPAAVIRSAMSSPRLRRAEERLRRLEERLERERTVPAD